MSTLKPRKIWFDETVQKLNVDKNLVNRVMNYASVKHIILKNFNDDQKKESLSLKTLTLKFLFFLAVIVVSYNLFFKNNNSAEDLTKIEKKENNSSFFSAIETAKKSLDENDDFITETLAKIYKEQGHYDKAINAFEKLILKFLLV